MSRGHLKPVSGLIVFLSSALVAQLVGGLTERAGLVTRGGDAGGVWSWAILATLLALLVLNAVLYHKLWGLEAWGKEASLGRIEMPLLK